ncbi:MAG: hypothetical protein ACPLRZ_01355 [Thermovenabulum sp.]|uniref:hypothetical protein n=1 Tax=Thermovenabulum sp. TaxID=3100335 RepID=UPI003C7AAB4B
MLEIMRIIEAIAKAIAEAGGRTFFVGGCVRDSLLGLPSKDYDYVAKNTIIKICIVIFRIDLTNPIK